MQILLDVIVPVFMIVGFGYISVWQNYFDENLIDALLKMYRDNSSTLTPDPLYSKFYFSHPPAKERVAFLKSFLDKSPASKS